MNLSTLRALHGPDYMPSIYLAHQVAPFGQWDVQRNLESAKTCARKIILGLRVAVSADWIWMVQTLDEGNPEHRAIGLECDKRQVRGNDFVLMTGPRVSSGMGLERDEAKACLLGVLNLTGPDYVAKLDRWIEAQVREGFGR